MTLSKERRSKSKQAPPPPDPVPGTSMEYLINSLDSYAVHLWHAKDEVKGSPTARAYRIAIEHIQTAVMWLKSTGHEG